MEKIIGGSGSLSVPRDRGADPDPRADRAARRRRNAEAPRRRHAPYALGELPRRAGARAALRLRLARPADRDAARRPAVRRRHAACGGPCFSARHPLASALSALIKALFPIQKRVLWTL